MPKQYDVFVCDRCGELVALDQKDELVELEHGDGARRQGPCAGKLLPITGAMATQLGLAIVTGDKPVPADMVTWENELLSDRWELRVNAVLKGAVDRGEECTGVWIVTDAEGVMLGQCAGEEQAKELLAELVLLDGLRL